MFESKRTITGEYFAKHVGHAPVNDDLDRCNCPDEGKVGHYCCGWNNKKNLPVFMVGKE